MLLLVYYHYFFYVLLYFGVTSNKDSWLNEKIETNHMGRQGNGHNGDLPFAARADGVLT